MMTELDTSLRFSSVLVAVTTTSSKTFTASELSISSPAIVKAGKPKTITKPNGNNKRLLAPENICGKIF